MLMAERPIVSLARLALCPLRAFLFGAFFVGATSAAPALPLASLDVEETGPRELRYFFSPAPATKPIPIEALILTAAPVVAAG
jgi:hypothetical protein